jgi:hypothetical protein
VRQPLKLSFFLTTRSGKAQRAWQQHRPLSVQLLLPLPCCCWAIHPVSKKSASDYGNWTTEKVDLSKTGRAAGFFLTQYSKMVENIPNYQ